MSTVISIFIYMVLWIVASVLVFAAVTSIWGTGEPGILFVLCLICCQLLLSHLAKIDSKKHT
ncbi:hypothetical protein LCL89_10050 [Halobacillus yeomjeoni]|uniref:hypothetical protein n=1 Tax=Halobacillus yeomjeoni TaxID=311194 RepID=UPI001CD7DD95|nr:hypothetical protein [Halobacillus yeomjeoni]MCA0984387.1 hypothetical protein [Halobacillus yeomjeoni]